MKRLGVVIPAGGLGRRMGGMRKQYVELAGQPLLLYSVRTFLGYPRVACVVVALPPEDVSDPPSWLAGLDPRLRLVAGGALRGDSVRNGLEALPADVDVVIVHDAARPLLTPDVIERTVALVARGTGALAAVPVTDTIKLVGAERRVARTLDRAALWQAQTPQAFPRALIMAAYRRAAEEGVTATDDAALVERYGGTVRIAPGGPDNLKVTTPADLALAEALLRTRGRAAGVAGP